MSELVIVGDQAYFPEEWARLERKRAHDRKRQREDRKRPEVRARNRAYLREYNKRPEVRAKKRQWMRDYRERLRVNEPRPVGFLHSLSCTSPHWRARKSCTPIPVYSKRLESVA